MASASGERWADVTAEGCAQSSALLFPFADGKPAATAASVSLLAAVVVFQWMFVGSKCGVGGGCVRGKRGRVCDGGL
jgi:hypothetical protein